MIALGKRAGVPDAHPHRFRDTFAVDLLVRGATPYDVAKLLGDTVDTIEKHYAPYVKELREQVRRLMENGQGIEQTHCTKYCTAACTEEQDSVKTLNNKSLSSARTCLGYSVSCTWAPFAKPCFAHFQAWFFLL